MTAKEAIEELNKIVNEEKPIKICCILITEDSSGLDRVRMISGGINAYESMGLMFLEAIRSANNLCDYGKIT